MAYERIPPQISTSDILNAAFDPNSILVPSLNLIIVNQLGLLAVIKSKNGKLLKIPEGTVHRPKIGENPLEKVMTTVKTRSNATLGHAAQVVKDQVRLVPYLHRTESGVHEPEQRRWPKAIGTAYMPVVVPTIIFGEDPKKKYEITWAETDQALDLLLENYQSYESERTRMSMEAIQVSRPEIGAITASTARR